MSRKTTSILAGAALAVLLSGVAYSQERIGTDTLLGDPIPADSAVDKVVNVTASTRWVNALQDESVRFVAGGKTFAWHFPPNRNVVNLKDIAPPGAIDRDLYVYLATDVNHVSGD